MFCTVLCLCKNWFCGLTWGKVYVSNEFWNVHLLMTVWLPWGDPARLAHGRMLKSNCYYLPPEIPHYWCNRWLQPILLHVFTVNWVLEYRGQKSIFTWMQLHACVSALHSQRTSQYQPHFLIIKWCNWAKACNGWHFLCAYKADTIWPQNTEMRKCVNISICWLCVVVVSI